MIQKLFLRTRARLGLLRKRMAVNRTSQGEWMTLGTILLTVPDQIPLLLTFRTPPIHLPLPRRLAKPILLVPEVFQVPVPSSNHRLTKITPNMRRCPQRRGLPMPQDIRQAARKDDP